MDVSVQLTIASIFLTVMFDCIQLCARNLEFLHKCASIHSNGLMQLTKQ